MTDDDTHESDELTYTFDASSGTISTDDGDHAVFSQAVTLNADAEPDGKRVLPGDASDFEGSFTLTFDTEPVVCPGCNEAVGVPVEPFLTLTRDPFPCHECGYPLL